MTTRPKRLTSNIWVRLDSEHLDKLRWLAEHEDRDMSKIVRRLIAAAFERAVSDLGPPAVLPAPAPEAPPRFLSTTPKDPTR